jgi:hypothetical protein
MRIIAPTFSVNLKVRAGEIVEADRPIRYMKGWTLARVLALAKRWKWEVVFNDEERAELESGPPSAA